MPDNPSGLAMLNIFHFPNVYFSIFHFLIVHFPNRCFSIVIFTYLNCILSRKYFFHKKISKQKWLHKLQNKKSFILQQRRIFSQSYKMGQKIIWKTWYLGSGSLKNSLMR